MSLTSKLSITLKVVGLGLLLKVLLTSSTERTLFPTDSEKSVIILFAKITSFDIVFEFFIGFNIFGLKSNYIGRIASFTGDELKIGGFYFGFLFLSLAFFSKKKIIYTAIIDIFNYFISHW